MPADNNAMLTTISDWTSLLADWESAARASHSNLPPVLSYPSASPVELAAAEARLKLTSPLPPSYRAFLLTTNGWQFASRAVPLIRPAAKLTWFKKQNREWINILTDPSLRGIPLPPEETYYNYSPEVSEHFYTGHLPHTLQISDIGDDAVFLLNPMVVHHDGEWEAWFLASWLPGVRRYRSFAALMWSQYHELIGQPLEPPFNTPVPVNDLPTVYGDPPTKTPRRIAVRKPRRAIPELLRIAQDHSPRTTMNARIKAIEELAARRDPTTVAPLRTLVHDPLPDVCAHAMIALGDLRAIEAVNDLIAIIQEHEENYPCAIAALGQIGTAPALDFLVSYIESRQENTAAAASAIAPHGDPRAVAIMTEIMLDTNDRFNGDIAGSILARFGRAGIEPLIAATAHPDLVVRRRAYKGLYELAAIRAKTPEGKRAAEALRARGAMEPDPSSTFLDTVLRVLGNRT